MSTNKDKPFEKGEEIEYAGDHFEVVENYGDSGRVKYLNDDSNDVFPFHWHAYGEDCKRINGATV